MKRRSILISTFPDNAIVNFWGQFLRSSAGGSWNESELVITQGATRTEIKAEIEAAKETDYTLIVFIGHGQIVKTDLPWNEMQIILRNNDILLERDLNSGSPRCTMIFDCCQNTSNETALNIPKSQIAPSPSKSRELYEQSLQSAESGIVKIYATGAFPSSPVHASFSQTLLQGAFIWAENNKGVLSLQAGSKDILGSLLDSNNDLKFEYHGGRRMRHFPLAIGL